MTYEEIKTKIAESHWDEQAIDTVEPALPKLGQSSLSYIYNRADEISGGFAISFAQTISQIPTWQDQIQSGNEDALTATFTGILRSNNLTSISLASAFITDVHNNKALDSRLTPLLARTLFLFQMASFENLSSREVQMALATHCVDLAMIFDLEMELKRYAYYKSYEPDAHELGLFRQSLENANQLINNSSEISVNKVIADFHNYTATLPAKGSSYAVAQYITASPIMKSLSKSDITVISRILNSYTWLLEGRYAEKEIEQYEKNRDQLIEKLPELIVSPPDEAIETFAVEVAPPEVYPEAGIFSEQVESDGSEEHAPISPPEPRAPQPTMDQKKIMQDIAAHAPANMRYNEAAYQADNATIQNLINHRKSEPRGGLVLERETNIKMGDETKRMEDDRTQKTSDIQTKLQELRNRNKSDA